MASKHNFITCPDCGKQLFVPSKQTEFENTVPVVGFPQQVTNTWAEAATNLGASATALIAVGSLSWYYHLPAWLPMSSVALVAVGLPLLKTVLYAPPKPKEEKPQKRMIEVEVKSDLAVGKRLQIAEDFGVPAEALHYAAARAVDNGFIFSRREIKKAGKVSQSQFEAIQEALIKRNWAAWKSLQTKDTVIPQEGIIINRNGQAVLRAIAAEKI